MTLPLTVRNFLLTFKEFLIVWLNQILYYNNIYDHLIFDKFTSFDLVIYKNRHPNLDQYIDQLFINIINELIIHRTKSKHSNNDDDDSFNGLYNINCLIYNVDTNIIIDKYTINFHQFIINLQETIFDLSLNSIDNSSKLNIDNLNWNEINTQYNTILFHHIQNLKKFQKKSQNLNSNNFFLKITVDVDKLLYINNNNPHGSNWIRLNNGDGDDSLTNITFTPIGQVDLDILNFNCYNESYL